MDAQFIFIACIAGVTLLILAVIFNPFRAQRTVLVVEPSAKLWRQIVLKSLEGEFETLRGKFAQQDRRFWSIVMAATKRVVQDEHPVQPAVLMLVSTEVGHSGILNCLAAHITDAVGRSHNLTNSLKIDLNSMTLSGKAPDALKLELDDLLSNTFGAGNKAALLYNIQDLPSRTAMLFHSYCDNTNAPFKDITLTFTFQLNTAASSPSDEEIEDHFAMIWSDLDKDTLSPLLSRIANSVAIVKPETRETMRIYCNA